MDDPGRQSDDASGQGLLFDLPATERQPEIRPWRPIEAGRCTATEKGLEDLLTLHLDLLRRNRQFRKALRVAEVSDETPDVTRFLETEADLVFNFIALKWGQALPAEVPELLAATRKIEQDLARLRREILIHVTHAQRDRALAAEPHIRPSDVELFRDIAAVEFHVAEETGEVVTWELELEKEAQESGLIGPADVQALAEALMYERRTDEERKPLPVRPRLKTLLKRIPVVWLDAICTHLGAKRERRRRERELAIAEALADPSAIRNLVQEVLGEQERELLAYLLKKEGIAKASAVTRAYGSDDEDGWFWEDRPPTSALGHLRLHGLVFIGGRIENGRNHRTVVIPEELREAILACLEGS